MYHLSQQKKDDCATCAKIVQPGQLPPTKVLIIKQLKLQRNRGEQLRFPCAPWRSGKREGNGADHLHALL